MSYARHQEAVSRALHDLIVDHAPLDKGSTELVLACRDQALSALRERLHHLGAGNQPAHIEPQIQVASVRRHPLHHLSRLLNSMPRTESADVPPSTLLPGPPATSAKTVSDRWRCVARDLLLGTAELTRADHQPWTTRSSAGWFLVADAASTVEAILILDQTLAKGGVLHAASERGVVTQRLIAGDVAKMARWFGTDNVADLAEAGIKNKLGVGGGPPISMVRRIEHYAVAQQTLTALLHGEGTASRPGTDQRPGLKAARALATGQIRLAKAFAHWAENETGDSQLANQFWSRVPAFRALHISTARMAEVEQRRSPLLLAQQSEMVVQLRSSFGSRPSHGELVDLNEATHELTATLGQTLRREATHAHNIVALDSTGLGLPRVDPITSTGWAFIAACQELADDPAPIMRREQRAHPVEREKLRTALEDAVVGRTPSVRRMPPAPNRVAYPSL